MSTLNIKQQCLSILDELSSFDILQEISGVSTEIEHFRGRLEDDEFRIAVVGEYSSGKSTFINAILGKDILTHATAETTAAITRIVNVAADDPQSYSGVVILCNGEKIPLHDFEKLREYTTKGSSQFDVVNDITAVELYMPILNSAHRIVLVDTPGLNGIAEGHRERTVQLVQQAHACIYLLQLRGLSESDVSFIKYLSRYQKNFIFVQNFIDEFQSAEGDSVAEKLQEQKEILEGQVFTGNSNVNYSICGVSALMALTYADESISSLYAGGPHLTADARKSLYKSSNFGAFQSLLDETFQEKNLEKIQYQDTALALGEWIKLLMEQIERRERMTRETYEASTDCRSMEKLIKLKEKVLAGKERQEEYLKNFIVSSCEDIRKEETERLQHDLEKVRDEVASEINQHKTIESLEQWSEKIAFVLQEKLDAPLHQYSKRYMLELQGLYQRLLSRIEEYSGIQNEKLSFERFEIRDPEEPTNDFQHKENIIAELRRKMESDKQRANDSQKEQIEKESERRKAEQEIQSLQEQKEKIESQKSSQLAHLGPKPKVEERWESYTDYEYRGGLGILDAIFGPKAVTHSRPVKDDSAAKDWDAKKAKIQNTYTEKMAELTPQLNAATRAAEKAKKESGEASQRYLEAKKKVLEREQAIKREEEVLAEQKKHAAQEFLIQCKKNLCHQVEEYLLREEDSILAQVTDNLKKEIVYAEENFIEWAILLYRKALQQKLEWIEEALQRECPELLQKANHLTQMRERLTQMQNILEEFR